VAAVIELDGQVEDAERIDVEALRAYCRANLAKYKVPEAFIVRVLPRNAMGKVILAEARKAVDGLDLDNPQI
jgi:acyl-CoA synthetase (AMP-forming)/AMP-acid ligase II